MTEPHAELNAGFVVVYASQHDGIIDWSDLSPMPSEGYAPETQSYLEALAACATSCFLKRMAAFIESAKPLAEMSDQVMGLWVQSGLALAPFCGAETRCSWLLAWSLLGEWACHHLFAVPTSDPWPRHGRDGALIEEYKNRRRWARAGFEQGALSPLLYLPGVVEARALPGDSKLQNPKKNLPDQILHGYGGAKKGIPTKLPLWPSVGG